MFKQHDKNCNSKKWGGSTPNYVCFDCRIALQVSSNRKCNCGKDIVCISHTIEVPKKSNKKAWEKLRKEIYQRKWEGRISNEVRKARPGSDIFWGSKFSVFNA